MEIKPQPVQEKFLASSADIAIFGGSAGSGKCIKIDTLIPTPCGFKRMGELKDGDRVFAVDGSVAIITHAFPIEFREEAYDVVFDSGEVITADADHLWKTMDSKERLQAHSRTDEFREKRRLARPSRAKAIKKNYGSSKTITQFNQEREYEYLEAPDGSVKTTCEILETLKVRGTRINHSVQLAKPIQLPHDDLLVDCYMLGYWLGDGDSMNGKVCGLESDIDEAMTYFKSEVLSTRIDTKGRNQPLKYVSFKGLTSYIRKDNLFKNKHIPIKYLRGSIEQRIDLLRGMMDTDGTCDKNGKCTIAFSNERLIQDTLQLLCSLGIKGTIHEKKIIGYKSSHIINFTPNFHVFNLKRKRDKQSGAFRTSRAERRYIVDVRKAEPCFMRCIEIDHPSHLYLIGRTFVPTHNSFALLMEPIRHINNPNFGGVIFRREAKQINNEGGLRDTALTIYPGFGGRFRSQPTPMFNFPSGARITFEHLNQESDVSKWQGSQIPFIAYDEITHFSSAQFWYMLSRNRSTCGVKPYVRASCNPDPDSWVAEFIKWWLDQETGYPIDDRSGKLRYFIRQASAMGTELVWGSSPHTVLAELNMQRPSDFELTATLKEIDEANANGEDIPDDTSDIILYAKTLRSVRSATFVPAKIYDNPALLSKDPGYLANLKAQSRVERGRLLEGNWKIRPSGGLYFPTMDAEFIEALPTTITKWVRSWDLAATEPTEEHDPDWTVGMKLGRRPDGMIIIADVIRIRRNARFVREIVRATAEMDGKHTTIRIPQDPGQAGREQADSYREMLRGFNIFSRIVTSKKTVMAEPVAAEWQRGRVALVRAPWNKEVLAELEQFPDAQHDDVVDALSGGYSILSPIDTPDYSAGGLSRRYR